MPVLSPEPAIYPASLFDQSPATDVEGRTWHVVHTLPRQEKVVARRLFQEQLPFFLPQIERRWRSRGRVVTSHLPLFPGYVFLQVENHEVPRPVLRRCVRMLAVPDQWRLLNELHQVHRLIQSGAPLAPEKRLLPGTTVEIRGGPLAGIRGKIIRSSSGNRFVVHVDFIQQGVSALLDDYLLEAVHEIHTSASA
jgi:transcriptional antiterminator RfaH